MKDSDLDFDKALNDYKHSRARDYLLETTTHNAIQFALALAKEIQAGDLDKTIQSNLLKEDTEFAKARYPHNYNFNKTQGEIEYWVKRIKKAMTAELIRKIKEDLTP